MHVMCGFDGDAIKRRKQSYNLNTTNDTYYCNVIRIPIP